MDSDAVYVFPDPLLAETDDVVAVGGNLSVGTLANAYVRGIFPWPHEGYPMLWFFPKKRGIICKENFKIPRSLKKWTKKTKYTFQWNQKFEEIIQNCQNSPRKNQGGTWITDEMKSSYLAFHKAGYAKCLAVCDGEELIGGIYGVYCKGVFSAESMFFKQSNASKVALKVLCEFLFDAGLNYVDVQMVTETTEQFGATYETATDYVKRLNQAQRHHPNLERAWKDFNHEGPQST